MKQTNSSARLTCLSELLESRRLFAAPSASVPFGLTDTTFGTAGFVQTGSDRFYSDTQIVTDSLGRIYTQGAYPAITRLTAAGKIDATFGRHESITPAAGSFVAEAVDASDRLYLLITLGGSDNGRTALLRYTPSGQLDAAFGTGGSALVTTQKLFTPTSLALQPDGEAIVAGTQTTADAKGREATLFRNNADGSVDTTFGTAGEFQAYLGVNTALTDTIYDVAKA